MPENEGMQSDSAVSVAPMMDWTDRHCRYFMRLLSPTVELYTEMVTAAAIYHGDADRLLKFDAAEHPVVVQLGGSDPELMANASARAAREGYDAININVGCPSDRVQSGQFGACLMADPQLVADCYRAMRHAVDVDVDVTVKSRIGIDDKDSFEFLDTFVSTLAAAGCRKFIVHARIALLSGLSPKENRSIPPLKYERVYRLKQQYPELEIVLNGGLQTIDQVSAALEHVDGVMIGREAYHNPWFLAELESAFGSGQSPPDRAAVVESMLPYLERELANGVRLHSITRHMLGLYAGQPGARAWRRYLSENARGSDAPSTVLYSALDAMRRAAA
jgi:tRNA-dihydrouridine synthase A